MPARHDAAGAASGSRACVSARVTRDRGRGQSESAISCDDIRGLRRPIQRGEVMRGLEDDSTRMEWWNGVRYRSRAWCHRDRDERGRLPVIPVTSIATSAATLWIRTHVCHPHLLCDLRGSGEPAQPGSRMTIDVICMLTGLPGRRSRSTGNCVPTRVEIPSFRESFRHCATSIPHSPLP